MLETGGLLRVFSLSAFAGGLSLFGLADVSASDLGLTVGTNAIYQFHNSQTGEDNDSPPLASLLLTIPCIMSSVIPRAS